MVLIIHYFPVNVFVLSISGCGPVIVIQTGSVMQKPKCKKINQLLVTDHVN